MDPRERLARLINDYPPEWDDALDAADRVLAAGWSDTPTDAARAQALGEAAVPIETLVWEEDWSGYDEDIPSWRGRNPLGLHVSFSFAGAKPRVDTHADANPDQLQAKKAAAQADYDARVRAALAIPPGTRVVVIPPEGSAEWEALTVGWGIKAKHLFAARAALAADTGAPPLSECQHPSYEITALGARCHRCGAWATHLAGGGLAWGAAPDAGEPK